MAAAVRFGTDSYRAGALERVEEARLLMDRERFALSIYTSGLAVEGMLRSLFWIKNKAFDERHDLRRLAIRVEELGLLRSGGRDLNFVGAVGKAVQWWSNNLRFVGSDQLATFLAGFGAFPQGASLTKRTVAIKKVCRETVDNCFSVVMRCDLLWRRLRRKNSRRS
ncbi:MAG: HEPN domain-containing protein [Planctomycetota bacterium]